MINPTRRVRDGILSSGVLVSMATLALWSILSAAQICWAAAAPGGVLQGAVSDTRGTPVAGAMVSATNVRLMRTTSVFTDAAGRFRMPPLEADTYQLVARRTGYKDRVLPTIEVGAAMTPLKLVLDAETDPRELANQLPASRWLPLVLKRLSSDKHREEFTRQCGFCHQIGSWATRVQRSDEDWKNILTRMQKMGGSISPELRAELPAAFNAAYSEPSYLQELTEPEFVPPPIPTGNAATALITEWDLGLPNSTLHDLVVHPDGTIYAADTTTDRLFHLDPKTNKREVWRIPPGDSPVGGVFAGTGTLQTANTAIRLGPHSLQVAPDGSLWITLCLADKIARFDPVSHRFKIFKQKDGLYPHTIRFDHKGRVWYTLAVSNGVGMIDPATGSQRTWHLPAPTFAQAVALKLLPVAMWAAKYVSLGVGGEGATLPVPYGIDVAPDGGIWFSQLNAHRIGRIDPDSGEIRIVETPFPGPRRLRFDAHGNLWIPSFSSGILARYTPSTGKFKKWKLPTGGVETPYAVNVQRSTGLIWICGTASDTIISFDPQSERFTVYPLPTRVSYTREIDFDDHGGVWTSNSNIPAWQIEAPKPELIRIQPGAAPRPE